MDKNINKQRLDTFLILIITLLVIISCFTLYTLNDFLPSYNKNVYMKQGIWFIVGCIAIATIMIIDFDRYRKLAWPLYILGVGMLAGLFFLPWAWENNGATRWYLLPPSLGNQTIQPSEFMKVFLAVTLAHVVASHNERWTKKDLKYDLILLGKIIALSFPPLVLIAVQPDLGSALVIASITAFVILISGIRWRVLITLFSIVFVCITVVIILYLASPDDFIDYLKEETKFGHVADRIQAWQQPHLYQDTSAMQVIKSMLAIGSGQLLGKGIMDYQVYIPERHTDMIFTAIAEQFGFIGSSVVIILYFLLIYRIIQIALECREPFGTYLCVGIVGMFSYQIFQNIGMSIQLLPLTGLPLPFLSYGGTSLLVYMAAIGLILNIRSRQKSYMFESEE
ncbi:FtsW/RodA/SpoVE family cell cycle protein [Bacillaceae bacterium W0354]